MKIISLLLISCCLSIQAFAQKEKFISDFDLFRNILEKAHAGLYKYHSPQQIDSIFSHYRKRVNDGGDLLSFYKHLSSVLVYIGSLHDDIFLPGNIKKKITSGKTFFPYPVKMVDGKLLVNIDDQKIPAGAEIVSVNGRSVKHILPSLYKYFTTDGINITGKQQGINAKFPWFYRLEYGAAAMFRVVYRPFNQQDSIKTTLTSVTWPEYISLYGKRHSSVPDTIKKCCYSFSIIDSLSTGLLTIPSFSLGNERSERHKIYRQFLKATFTSLKEKGIKNLIVDIRQNGGGSDPNDLLTFSYLAQQPFKENTEAFTLFQTIPFKQYCTDDTTDILDLEENLGDEHNQFKDGKYFQNPEYNRFWQPDSLAFTGKIYLLIGPAVASAASLFASMVKSEGKATVIGEETMGGYYGHTGHNSISFELPATHIPFSISVVDLRQYVSPKEEITFGSGILPDIRLQQSQPDFIINRDTVLDSVMHIIKSVNVER